MLLPGIVLIVDTGDVFWERSACGHNSDFGTVTSAKVSERCDLFLVRVDRAGHILWLLVSKRIRGNFEIAEL